MTDRVQILTGDACAILKTLEDESVHCVVTSPPYFGLRSYQGGEAEIGTESTPAAYVANLVDVFREVRRVLRKDGTVWLNLGDSYASNTKGSGGKGKSGLLNDGRPEAQRLVTADRSLDRQRFHPRRIDHGLKEKDLIGIPWRVAFALQDDGWWLRSDIIWDKPNVMPSSVRDRPTTSHEHLFLLTKSPKYYYDNVAIAEPLAHPTGPWGGRNPRPGVDVNEGNQATREGFRDYVASGVRNKRDVWRINTQPYKGAHFAVFPEALVTPCILAGSSEKGCCSECGAPWKRVVERKPTGYDGSKYGERAIAPSPLTGSFAKSTLGSTNGKLTAQYETTDWEPTCNHVDAPVTACTILDPFCGSGTTLKVALKHNRNAIGIELNPEYVALAQKRIHGVQPVLGL